MYIWHCMCTLYTHPLETSIRSGTIESFGASLIGPANYILLLFIVPLFLVIVYLLDMRS